MRILVVDDEEMIREVIKEYCVFENYEVLEADNGFAALDVLDRQKIDLVVLDIMMPKLDGYSTYKEIKKRGSIPTILLSARSEEYDKLFGFELGIDDYMTKPFSPKELIARIKAITNRTNRKEEKFIYRTLLVDFLSHSVAIDDKEVKLTPKEFDLLTYFIQNKNIAITREQLLTVIWGFDFFGDDRTIDTHIKMLRGNLGKYRDLIVTVRGVGYKFEIKENK